MASIQIIWIVLLVLGLALIGVEMAIPGFGAPGICGIISLGAGVAMTARSLQQGVVIVIVIIVILAVMMAVIMTILSSKKVKGPIVLEEEVKGGQYLSSSDLEYLVGKKGTAVTDLRPAGKGKFEGIEFDILSDGKYIRKGEEIEIIRIRENRIIVSSIG